ncbi:MAG: hypothetical protein HW421_3219 [Ignavibacteria bacterium]|nr:hypothetical protein [Ignavibacteria bacterium]
MNYKFFILSIVVFLHFYGCGNEITTNPTPVDSTTVTIGSQVWMKKNLDVAYYSNGDKIPQITDSAQWLNLKTGAWCYYGNDLANGAVYGRLYNWYAVNDPRGLAPTGWHVASDSEWTTLTVFLGGENVAGGKLIEEGTIHWQSPNSEGTNKSGFTALPGGFLDGYGGFFAWIGRNGRFWSATESYENMAIFRSLHFSSSAIYKYSDFKKSGFSVRCVKDGIK